MSAQVVTGQLILFPANRSWEVLPTGIGSNSIRSEIASIRWIQNKDELCCIALILRQCTVKRPEQLVLNYKENLEWKMER